MNVLVLKRRAKCFGCGVRIEVGQEAVVCKASPKTNSSTKFCKKCEDKANALVWRSAQRKPKRVS